MVQVIFTKPLHSCEYCGLDYWKTPAYIKHLVEFHTIDLPKCSFCLKQFLSSKDLNEHLEDIHTIDGGIKRHKCLSCSSSFKWLGDLKNHLARKHGPNAKPVLQCRHCGCQFYQRSTYANHMLDKHWTKNVFQCNECLYKFKYKSLLVKHIEIKHGTFKQWMKCKFCPASYKWGHSLEAHYKQRHRTLWLKICSENKNESCTRSFDACHQGVESQEKLLSRYGTEHIVNITNEEDSSHNDMLKTKQITNHNVDKKYCSLRIVPESFPQDIIDFEFELQKQNEFKQLINKRILCNRTEQNINNHCNDRNSSETERIYEQIDDSQHLLQINNKFTHSLFDSLNNDRNLITEERKDYIKRNNSVKESKHNTYNQNDKDTVVLKKLKIVLTRLDDKMLNTINREIQSNVNISTFNIHDIKASHLISNDLSNDINVKKKIPTFYSCNICKLKFRVKKNLDHHTSEQHNNDRIHSSHKCKFCEAVFPYKYYLRQHLKGEHQAGVRRVYPRKCIETCTVCKLTFKSKQLLNIHMTKQHPHGDLNILKCVSRNNTFNARGLLHQHRRLKHSHIDCIKNSFNKSNKLEDGNTSSYICKTRRIIGKNNSCSKEHAVQRFQKHRQYDLEKISKKTEKMKLKKKALLNSRRNVKSSTGIRKNGRQKMSAEKFRSFDQSLVDFNSQFVLTNSVITRSKSAKKKLDVIVETEKLKQASSSNHCFVNKMDSQFCSSKRKFENKSLQVFALKGLDIINTHKHVNKNKNVRDLIQNFTEVRKSMEKKQATDLMGTSKMTLDMEVDGYRKNYSAQEGLSQNFTEETKSVEKDQARDLLQTRELILNVKVGNYEEGLSPSFTKERKFMERKQAIDLLGTSEMMLDVEIDDYVKNQPAGEGSSQNLTEEEQSMEEEEAIDLLGTRDIIFDVEVDGSVKNQLVEEALSKPFTEEKVKLDDRVKNRLASISQTNYTSSQCKSTVKDCVERSKFPENITQSSHNSEYVSGDKKSVNYQSVSSNFQQDYFSEIDINSEGKQKGTEVITSAEIVSNKQVLSIESDETCELGELVSITTDQTELNSDCQYSVCRDKTCLKKHHPRKCAKDYKCKLCNCIFNNKKSLTKHLDFHNICYRCPVCYSVFKMKEDLTLHIRIKHDIPIYTNTPNKVLKNIYNDHSYSNKHFDKRTIVENTPPDTDVMKKQLKCNFCNKYFTFTEKLHQHIAHFHKITKVTLSMCAKCDAVFNSHEDLRDHVTFVHSADNGSIKCVSQDETETSLKVFNWKKALVQTYKSESNSDNDTNL